MKFIASLFTLSLFAFTQASPFSPINVRDAAITKPTLTSRATNSSECWKSLSCSFSQIEGSTLSDRLAYVQYLQALFVPLNAGDEFRPFEGLINLTASADIGKPGTWTSYVIAGIVEGIQRGGAIALGTGTSDAGNPGSKLWADFLTKTKNKQLGDRDVCELLSLCANSILFRRAIYSPRFIYRLFPTVFSIIRPLMIKHVYPAAKPVLTPENPPSRNTTASGPSQKKHPQHTALPLPKITPQSPQNLSA